MVMARVADDHRYFAVSQVPDVNLLKGDVVVLVLLMRDTQGDDARDAVTVRDNAMNDDVTS